MLICFRRIILPTEGNNLLRGVKERTKCPGSRFVEKYEQL